MRLPRIIIAILTLAVGIAFTGMPETTTAATPGIVEVSPQGDAFHFIRVCGWKSYSEWGCVEQGYSHGTSGVTYRTSQTWITERGVYTDVHFDHLGARRCDKRNSANGSIGFLLFPIGPFQSYICDVYTPR